MDLIELFNWPLEMSNILFNKHFIFDKLLNLSKFNTKNINHRIIQNHHRH
jgi:hypothetical protein